MKFRTVRAGNRPLLAFPENPTVLRGAAFSCYPAHTWKKRLIRKGLAAVSQVGLLPWAAPRSDLPLAGVEPEAFEGWLDQLARDLRSGPLYPVFVWPADPGRKRIYLHLLAGDGRKVGFCKMGLDRANNRLIRHEAEMLGELGELSLTQCRVPRVLAAGALGESVFLVVEPTPSAARVTDWQRDPPVDAACAEYAGAPRRMAADDLKSMPWLAEARNRFPGSDALAEALGEAVRDGSPVCRVHGDLNQTNVLRAGNELWLLDWERSGIGPVLTDPVCAFLDRLWLEAPSDAPGNLEKLQEKFGAAPGHELLLALAYLTAAGFPPARDALGQWFPRPD